MRVGTLSELWRYPVKSMGGEPLTEARISRRGIPGDRGWAVHDDSRQGITTAKRLPPLRNCRARYEREPAPGDAPPPAMIALPNGVVVSSDSPDAARQISALTGRDVTLRSLGPVGSDAAPRVASASDSPETVRALMGILPGETEPDYSAFTPERLRELRQDNFFDAYPVHLITRTTLATLRRLGPDSDWAERRFRANLIVESIEREGFPEHEWVGRRLRVGHALLEVVMGCPRCVMVPLSEAELPQDPRIMRTLVRETRHIAGIYLSVVEEGDVRPGDAIEWVVSDADGRVPTP